MSNKNIVKANPQGKASIALLDDLKQQKLSTTRAKESVEWLADYFTSILILSASFSFKPVMNKTYYLYYKEDQWKLSLIEPQVWPDCPYTFFAECCMHEDRSWSLYPIDNWEEHLQIAGHIKTMQEEFIETINTDAPILDILPYHVSNLPYYQRLAAFGLANSLKNSLIASLGREPCRLETGNDMLKKIHNLDQLSLTSR